jgi:hypothetical protein
MRNTQANTRLTTAKVPSDSVTVVTRICRPALRSFFHSSSVPIIRPATHSKRCSTLPNQAASSVCWSSRFSAWGPSTIPAISQPRMTGIFSFEASLPAPKARTMTAKSRRICKKIIRFASFQKNRRNRL